MAELHENSGGWLHAEAALLKAHFLGRGNQLELIGGRLNLVELSLRRRGLGKHCRHEKQQDDGKKESFFHSYPCKTNNTLFYREPGSISRMLPCLQRRAFW